MTRHWLIPQAQRPKVYAPHPVMSPDEIRARTQAVWDLQSATHLGAITKDADHSGSNRVRLALEVFTGRCTQTPGLPLTARG